MSRSGFVSRSDLESCWPYHFLALSSPLFGTVESIIDNWLQLDLSDHFNLHHCTLQCHHDPSASYNCQNENSVLSV